MDITISRLGESDPGVMAQAFEAIGWNKPKTRFEQYLEDQQDGRREVLVAWASEALLGYVTVCWESEYEPVRQRGVPEIQDLNVLPAYRRRGIGTRLLDEAEGIASERHSEVGIGVGLHPGYNAAQRLYARRGYAPDGRGVTYRNECVSEGATVLLDDDLVLHLTKVFSERGASRSETSVSIRPLAPGEADACEQLLRSLPEWFGIERAIIEYRRALDVLETFVGQIDGELAGFLALERHSPHAAEIHVMAVSRPLQARGIGSALLEHAERRLLSESVEYLEVKTLGPSRPDANYERTRKFYLARGFRAIKETDLWGKDDPCLILVKHLNCSGRES